MLDLSLHAVAFRYPNSDFAIRDATVTFPRQTHTAIIGAAASGKTTLLRLLSGQVRPGSGEVTIGAHVVNKLAPDRRPLLYAGPEPDFPLRWSVRHVIIAALRRRSLDRQDRLLEFDQAVSRWSLEPLLDRKVRTLSDGEKLSVHLAWITSLRPAVLIAERVLQSSSAGDSAAIADGFFRTLRVLGTTVISEPARIEELGYCDKVVAISDGAIVQEGSPKSVYDRPVSLAIAATTGNVNVVPLTIRGTQVESPIGSWQIAASPFEGNGVAAIRPTAFALASRGEESDFVLGVEEAWIQQGSWTIRGFVTGGVRLEATFPAEAQIHKGKLIPLKYDPAKFTIFPSEHSGFQGVPTDVVPPVAESR